MTRATLILRNDKERERACNWARRVPPGTTVEFTAPRRSLEQNKLLWASLQAVSDQVVWYGQKLSAEDWKDIFTASLRKARVVPGLDAGTFVPLGMRTSDMTKQEFSALLELIFAFGAEKGVVFPDEERAA